MNHFGIFYIVLLLFLSGCNWFSTRTPEEPDTGRSSFIPPTEDTLVIVNLVKAFEEKNIENYIACLADTGKSYSNHFLFTASADANARFQALFNTWDLTSEKSYFNYLISSLPEELVPELIFTHGGYDWQLPDSASYSYDYRLKVPHSYEDIPLEFAGRMHLTLITGSNGLWSISRWIDNINPDDSIQATWSLLKAEFSN